MRDEAWKGGGAEVVGGLLGSAADAPRVALHAPRARNLQPFNPAFARQTVGQ